jgi:hypothetical protein
MRDKKQNLFTSQNQPPPPLFLGNSKGGDFYFTFPYNNPLKMGSHKQIVIFESKQSNPIRQRAT